MDKVFNCCCCFFIPWHVISFFLVIDACLIVLLSCPKDLSSTTCCGSSTNKKGDPAFRWFITSCGFHQWFDFFWPLDSRQDLRSQRWLTTVVVDISMMVVFKFSLHFPFGWQKSWIWLNPSYTGHIRTCFSIVAPDILIPIVPVWNIPFQPGLCRIVKCFQLRTKDPWGMFRATQKHWQEPRSQDDNQKSGQLRLL